MAISSNSLEPKFAPDMNLFSKLISSLFNESIVFLNSSGFNLNRFELFLLEFSYFVNKLIK